MSDARFGSAGAQPAASGTWQPSAPQTSHGFAQLQPGTVVLVDVVVDEVVDVLLLDEAIVRRTLLCTAGLPWPTVRLPCPST